MSAVFLDAERRLVAARAKLARRTDPLTIAEASELLGVHPRTLFHWRQLGRIDWQARPANRHTPPSAFIDPAALRRLIEPNPAS